MTRFQVAQLDTPYDHWISWAFDERQHKVHLAVTSLAGLQIAEAPYGDNAFTTILDGLAQLLWPFNFPHLEQVLVNHYNTVDDEWWELVEPVTLRFPPPIDDFDAMYRIQLEDAYQSREVLIDLYLQRESFRSRDTMFSLIIQVFHITNPDVLLPILGLPRWR